MNCNSAVNGGSDSEVPKAKKLQDDVGSKSERLCYSLLFVVIPITAPRAKSAARCRASPQTHHPEPRLLKAQKASVSAEILELDEKLTRYWLSCPHSFEAEDSDGRTSEEVS
jgi:hypothetical protein